MPVVSGGGYKHGDKSFDGLFGDGIPDLLINLMSCCVFLNNMNYIFILKCPKSMLE